jgi:hypothetical protein
MSDRFAGLAVGDENRRAWVGRSGNGDASVSLMDEAGHKRIIMKVAANGDARLDFLDGHGRVIRELLPSQPM